MTETAELPAYRVRRSTRARRARLTIGESGEAIVVLPAGAAERTAAELVAKHARWVEHHRQRIGRRNAALAARPAVGEGRPLRLAGIDHAVVVEKYIEDRRRTTVELACEHEPPTIIVRPAADDARATPAIVERWLRDKARRLILERVAARSAEMNVSPAGVSIRDQRTRWGSASHHGTLSFSWRLVLCPPEILDYVVVHELAHLRVRGHSTSFWSLVRRHFPDPERARWWLRDNHAALQHALD